MKDKSKLQAVQAKIDSYRDYISSAIINTQFPSSPQNLYEPVRYILSLGGKRMRPILAMMSCEMFSGEFEKATNAALAVEIFHNFTLIHDDIMDEAPLRRGKETVHKKWNSDVGLLSGDVLMIESYIKIASYRPEILLRLLNLYNKTAIEVCEGQQMDMDFETSDSVSIADYVQMIKLKTAVLLGCSLELGAIVGGASEKDGRDLYEFGTNLGIAFQLQDDILDVFGNQNKFGKQVGGDIIANKKTFLLLTAIEDANESQLERLNLLLSETNNDIKLKGVLELYAELKIEEKAKRKLEEFHQIAMNRLNSINIEEDKKLPLKLIADYLFSRDS